MIYLIDEHFYSMNSWTQALRRETSSEIRPFWSADNAYDELHSVPKAGFELAIVDVMLSVTDPDSGQFSPMRTHDYHQTGLRLLEDLAIANDSVFPRRAVFLTNAIEETLRAAESTTAAYGITLWRKTQFESPSHFARTVSEHIARLDRLDRAAGR